MKTATSRYARSGRGYITAIILLSYFGLGLIRAQDGVVFLDLLLIIREDIERGSLLFLFSSPGFMVGSLASGLLCDRYNPGLVYTCGLVWAGALSFVVPFCSTLPLMGCAMFARAAFAGFISTGGTFIFVTMWKAKANSFIQMLHFTFAIGALMIPLITEPFLSARNKDNQNETANWFVHNASDTVSFIDEDSPHVLDFSLNDSGIKYINDKSSKTYEWKNVSTSSNGTTPHVMESHDTDVYISFLITGCYLLVASLPFIVHAVRGKMVLLQLYKVNPVPSVEKANGKDSKSKPKCQLRQLLKNLCIYGFICVLYLTYGAIEKGCVTFLMPYAVQHLKLTKTDAARLMSCFWGAFAASRCSAILKAKYFSEFKMLLFDFASLSAGISVLFAATAETTTPLWVAVVIIGAGQAGIFPTAAAWINRRVIPVSGLVSALFCISGATGSMIHLPLLGYLFEEFSPLWFIYLTIGVTSICFIACIALFFISMNRKSPSMEINVEKIDDSSQIT